jgi:hypothetical protein
VERGAGRRLAVVSWQLAVFSWRFSEFQLFRILVFSRPPSSVFQNVKIIPVKYSLSSDSVFRFQLPAFALGFASRYVQLEVSGSAFSRHQ